MDELIKESLQNFNVAESVNTLNLLVSLILSTVLSMALSKSYMIGHNSYSYSRNFVQSLVLLTITIALIMIIIGSNIARAFALVGAMSIVRFRNPIKDTQDLVFIFIAIAIGMACGTQFYLFAFIFTAFVLGLRAFFEYSQFGELGATSFVVKIKSGKDVRNQITEFLNEASYRVALISIDSIGQESDESIYEISLDKKQNYESIARGLGEIPGVSSIQLLVGESGVNI